MSDNHDLKFTHLSDGNGDLSFLKFRPNTLLNFDEILNPTTNLEFDKSAIISNDVSLNITANIVLTASGNIIVAETPTGLSISGNITPIALGSIKAEEAVSGVSINAVYELNAIASGAAKYDSNNQQFVSHYISSDIQNSRATGLDKISRFEQSNLLASKAKIEWQQSKFVSTDNQSVFESNEQLSTSSTPVFEQSKIIGISSKQLYENQLFIAHAARFDCEKAILIGHGIGLGFEAMHKRQTERQIINESADWIGKYRQYSSRSAQLIINKYDELIETAKGIYSSQSERFIVIPDVPDPIDLVMINFNCMWFNIDTGLKFGNYCQQEQNPLQPSKGVIFVTNSVSLVRSYDGREIKMLGFTVGIDSNSYTWSFSATVPLSELSKVDIAYEQQIGVEFTCNGHLWRFILDSCDDSASFGESSLTIKGKSRAMLLASPYSAQRGFKYDTAMSARQIAEDELNRFGIPSGFTLDWQLAGTNGWQVPANTYSYSNKTPINSLQWIAEAAGGFINAHMSEDIIHVLAHYPLPSWEWSAQTPNIELPMSLITSRSRGRVNKPAYNGVTVYGEHEGSIGALIKRRGTSGGYQPPMITSDLITDQDAAISRGKMVLSDTGDIGNIDISMPLHEDIGILLPSELVGVNDGESWIGKVSGTTITGKLNSNRALEIEQTTGFERHFDKEVVSG